MLAIGHGPGRDRHRRVAAAVAIAALLLVRSPARAQALSCGRALVLPGASAAEVLRKCGAPTSRQSLARGAAASSRAPSRRDRSARSSAGGRGAEVWTYDAGSRQLVRYLTFDRGRLVRIDFGAYGGRGH